MDCGQVSSKRRHNFDMGSKAAIILRAIKRVSLASAGEVIGRAVNLSLPFFVLFNHGANSNTDLFFFVISISFLFYGSLANVLITTFVPEFINNSAPKCIRQYTIWVLALGVLTGVTTVVFTSQSTISTDTLVLAISASLISFAGLLSAPAVAALASDHHYIVAGTTWGLRLIPILIYFYLGLNIDFLPLLLSGIAVSDCIRTSVLLLLTRRDLSINSNYKRLKIPTTAKYLIISNLIAGLAPLMIRWIASQGTPGSLSIYEVAERSYGAIASFATIGMSNVILVYLSQLKNTSDDDQYWTWIVRAAALWAIMWFMICAALGALFPYGAHLFDLVETEAFMQMIYTFLALSTGLPGFIFTIIFSRRLFTLGQASHLVPLAAFGLGLTCIGAFAFFPTAGTIGLAIAYSLTQYIVAILMYVRLKQFHDET